MPSLNFTTIRDLKIQNLHAIKNITGQIFGNLKVISLLGSRSEKGRWRVYWLCRCVCGAFTIRRRSNLFDTASCGCARRTHGGSAKLAYSSWSDMIRRTSNKDHRSYNRYGGRGITVCERWMVFEHFLEDMGDRPNRNLSINRVDNDGHYSCGTCKQCVQNEWPMNAKWDDIITQANNRSNNRILLHNGQSRTLAGWGRLLGIDQRTLSTRIVKGWDAERVLSPFNDKSIVIEYNGEKRNLTQWDRLLQLPRGTMAHRYRRGLRGDALFKI